VERAAGRGAGGRTACQPPCQPPCQPHRRLKSRISRGQAAAKARRRCCTHAQMGGRRRLRRHVPGGHGGGGRVGAQDAPATWPQPAAARLEGGGGAVDDLTPRERPLARHPVPHARADHRRAVRLARCDVPADAGAAATVAPPARPGGCRGRLGPRSRRPLTVRVGLGAGFVCPRAASRTAGDLYCVETAHTRGPSGRRASHAGYGSARIIPPSTGTIAPVT